MLRNPRRVLSTLLPALALVLAGTAATHAFDVPHSSLDASRPAPHPSLPALTAGELQAIADDGAGPASTGTAATEAPEARKAPTPTPAPRRPRVTGIASHYPGTRGFIGQAAVALPGPLGGQYTGGISGTVTVCAERCATLPVVDYCDCYWGTSRQRVADLTPAAWALVTDLPLSRGLVTVTVILD
jgi:hypothetical protein